MVTCAAFGCTNRSSKKNPGVTFHNFPKDKLLRSLWILAVRRANWEPTNSSRLCSEHFTEEQIDRTSSAVVRLRENAVPTKFDGYPSHLQLNIKEPPKPPRTECLSEPSLNGHTTKQPPVNTSLSELSTQDLDASLSKRKANDVLNVVQDKNCLREPFAAASQPPLKRVLSDLSTEEIQNLISLPSSTDHLRPPSPTKEDLEREVNDLLNVLENKNKTIKGLQQKVRRYEKRFTHLKSLISELKQKNHMPNEKASKKDGALIFLKASAEKL